MNLRGSTVSVLGLGLLGTAVASRLVAQGAAVTGWSRRSAPPGVAAAATAAEAVAGADVVLLVLFDAAACRDVLAACLDAVPPDCAVVNLSTVAPDEARRLAELVTGRQRRYLHCPVIGSVPAVGSGDALLLPGDPRPATPAADVLTALGRLVTCPDTGTAAALKLLANGVLAGSLLTLGTALGRADLLGIDPDLLPEVLAGTALGGLAAAKRPWLTGVPGPTEFTVAALRKDTRLLADLVELGTTAEHLAAVDVPTSADIGTLATAFVPGRRIVDAGARLDAEPTVPADPALLAPLIDYARGHATGDPAHFRRAFRPSAHVEGLRDGEFVSWDLDAYRAVFPGEPAADESRRSRTIIELRRRGDLAHATMLLRHVGDTFTDVFLLIDDEAGWRIANKAYHRHPA